jgi:pyroglutamyl-peptidase
MSERTRRTILITGFGPFPGHPRNASGLLAELLADITRRSLPGYDVRAAVLPVEWQAGPQRLAELLRETSPFVALHFGVSRRARGFVIEQRAVNVAAESCDASGAMPVNCAVAAGGPGELQSTFPASLILTRLRRLGLPVKLSRNAGHYLCNSVLYHSLAESRAADLPRIASRRGFVHIPSDLVGGGHDRLSAGRGCPLDWEGAVRGGFEIVQTCVRR